MKKIVTARCAWMGTQECAWSSIIDESEVEAFVQIHKSRDPELEFRIDDVPHKTEEQAIAEGYAYLASLGWTQDALMSAPYAANTGALQIKLEENAVAVLTMRAAAKADPANFDPKNFTIPHSPDKFGL